MTVLSTTLILVFIRSQASKSIFDLLLYILLRDFLFLIFLLVELLIVSTVGFTITIVISVSVAFMTIVFATLFSFFVFIGYPDIRVTYNRDNVKG